MKKLCFIILFTLILLVTACVSEKGSMTVSHEALHTDEQPPFTVSLSESADDVASSSGAAAEPFASEAPIHTSTPVPTQTAPSPSPSHTPAKEASDVSKKPYLIRINRILNCVTVYKADENGKYSIPYKAFVCSTGTDTPEGCFSTTDKYVWRALFGDVYGQYATRIVGSILFHSVPYHSMDKSDLEYEEYNKLGTAASMGCIRLTCIDAKWIYDNCPKGTAVEIYDDETSPGPLGKPEPVRIDPNSEYRGWDPTDPDPENPWND